MKNRICFTAVAAALFLLADVQAQAQDPHNTPAAQTPSANSDGTARVKPESSNTAATPVRKTLDAEKRALDLLLAETLTDPMSAIQYRLTSQIVTCGDLVTLPQGQVWSSTDCVCYEVNTRGENNAYKGAKRMVASLRKESDGTYKASGVPYAIDDRRMWTTCTAAGWEKRPFKLIHEQVN